MNEPPTDPLRGRTQPESTRRTETRDPGHPHLEAGTRGAPAPPDDPRRPGLEALITSISTELTILDPARLDSAVGQALQRVGEAVEVDHAWLCRISADGSRIRLIHEWCTYGASAFDVLDDVALDHHTWLWERLRSHEAVSVPAIGDLPPEAGATAGLLSVLGLGSMLAIPLANGSRLRGYAAFATRSPAAAFSPDDLALLRFVGDILADALERIEEESRRASDVRVEVAEPAGTVELLRGQREILEKIAAGVDRDAALAGLGKLAERYVPRMRPSIWSLDPLGETLRLVAGDLPTRLRGAIEELEPGTDVGPFGLSCEGERVVIDDVMRDPTFQAYHHEALAGGVRSCWTEPVKSAAGRVIGVVALVGRDASTPSPGEQELIQDVARMTGLALERYGDATPPDATTPVRPEEERLEELLRQARKMQALGRQAGAVVREFNNAFTAILGNTEMLLEGVRDSRGEHVVRREHVGHETVLVCEADDMVRELAANVLESYGYTVLTAPDGDQAQRIATAHEGRIHLLVADSLTQGMNGRELAHQLARRCPDLQVLLTSGYPAGTFDRLARGPRSADVLEKPYAAVDLVARVRQTLDAGNGI